MELGAGVTDDVVRIDGPTGRVLLDDELAVFVEETRDVVDEFFRGVGGL